MAKTIKETDPDYWMVAYERCLSVEKKSSIIRHHLARMRGRMAFAASLPHFTKPTQPKGDYA